MSEISSKEGAVTESSDSSTLSLASSQMPDGEQCELISAPSNLVFNSLSSLVESASELSLSVS